MPYFRAGAGVFAAAFAAAFCKRHRFFVAATILAMPSLLKRRFAFAGLAGADGSDSPRILAHRRCWASFMRFRAAALIFRRLRLAGSGLAADSGEPPERMARSSAIRASI